MTGSQTNSLRSLKEVFSFSRAETIALGILLGICLIGGGALIYENSRQTIQPQLIFQSIESAQAVESHADVTTQSAPSTVTPAKRVGVIAPMGALKVNINTAPAESLALLPLIGDALSRRIVDYRTKHGPFSAVDELIAVYGIGPRNIEKIRPYLICR